MFTVTATFTEGFVFMWVRSSLVRAQYLAAKIVAEGAKVVDGGTEVYFPPARVFKVEVTCGRPSVRNSAEPV